MTSATRKKNEGARKKRSTVFVGEFKEIDERIRGKITEDDAVEVFKNIAQVSLLMSYEQGAILNYAEKYWFPKAKSRFQNFVLNTLRIDLARASRLMRIHRGLKQSGMEADDFNGISESSLLLLLPVMTGTAPVKTQLGKLMELAKDSTVETVKAAVYKARGIKPAADEAFSFKTLKALGDLGKKFRGRDHFFAYVIVNRQGKVLNDAHFNKMHEGFFKAWQETVSAFGAVQFSSKVGKKAKKVSAISAKAKAKRVSEKAKRVAKKADVLVQNEIAFKKDAA